MTKTSSLVAALLALASASAFSATATVATTLDVNSIVAGSNGFTGGVQDSPPFTPGFSVVLAEGDTFDFTISFLGGQTLTIDNPTFLWAFSYADAQTEVSGTGSLSLLDTAGNVLWASNPKTDVEGSVHFGQFFDASDFAALPSSITFAALHYVGTVNDYVDPTITSRTYSSPGFYFSADGFSVTAVPEPETYALMLAGLAAIGWRRRREDARAG